MSQIYEGMFLLDNDVVREGYEGAKALVTGGLDKHGATVLSARRWDERRLAYPIDGRRRATFVIAYYQIAGGEMPALRREFDLSEQVLRTPFLLAGPGIPSGARFEAAVENIDLFPTLLALCDLPRPGGLHGVDLTPLLAGESDPGDWREESYAYIRQAACLREESSQLKLVVPTEYGIRKGMRGPTLHDLGEDPRERKDLARTRPQDLARLRARLEAHTERYPTTIQRVGDRISQQRLEALGYAGQGNEEEGG